MDKTAESQSATIDSEARTKEAPIDASSEIPLILIWPAESGDYRASVVGSPNGFAGASLAEALSTCAVKAGVPLDAVSVKVQEGTFIATGDILELLKVLPIVYLGPDIGNGRRLDLSGCEMPHLDLSPASLAEHGVTERRGFYGLGVELSGVNLAQSRLWAGNFQNARLFGANLAGAVLSRSRFEDAALSFANMDGCVLWGANLQRAGLIGASLRHVTLDSADLRGVDLRTAGSLAGAQWHNALLDKTWVYRRQIGELAEESEARANPTFATYQRAAETYLTLKTNFTSLGNYEDAAAFYVKEQQMEKMALFQRWSTPSPGTWSKPSHWLHLTRRRNRGWKYQLRVLSRCHWGRRTTGQSFLLWTRSWLYELLTGYGERPHMPVLWGFVTIISFFLVYWGAGNIATGDPSLSPSPSHNPVDAFTHSVSAFATIGFNTLEPVGWGARLLTAVESMFGIGFFALFIYTLGNRMSRS